MRRRRFIKIISFVSLGIGSTTYLLSYFSNIIFKKAQSPYHVDHDVIDKMAFVETVYPFFTVDQLLINAGIILKRKREWKRIDDTFFKDFYIKTHNRFYTYDLEERERFIAQFIAKHNQTGSNTLKIFTKARIGLMKYVYWHSFFPYSAYGYPDKKRIARFADPSWHEYHLKPGSIRRNN